MEEKQKAIQETVFKEAERREKKVILIVTLVTGIVLGLLFIMDLVFFIIGAIEWYIFLVLLAIYVIVFPAAIFLMTWFRKSVRQAEAAEALAAANQLRDEIITDIERGNLPETPAEITASEKKPDFLDQYDE